MKNCIAFLSRSDINTLRELKHNLDRLYDYYVNDFPCDVVILHEVGFPETFKLQAEKKYSNIKFKEINFQAPDFLTPENLRFKDPTHLPLSYRNMCRFFFTQVFNVLGEYDWYWRLDVDSILLKKINFDVFKYLEQNNKVYGYVAEILEYAPAIKHMDEYVHKYMERNNITGEFVDYLFPNGKYNFKMIYNNFEIAKTSLFKTPEIQKFINSIDRSGYIYEYRWGDAPLRTALLSLFVRREQIHRFKNIDYLHQGFKQENEIITCEFIPEEWLKNDDFIA